MKRRFTILTAALALLAFLALPMGMRGQTRETVTDHMTASDLAATSTTYTDFSNVTLTSDAVYAGQSAKSSAGAIQLRSKNSNSGIVTTTSGGTIASITITVESGSNTIDVYGKNSAYSAASDLYGNAGTQGTKLGSLSATGTITVTDDYEYVGIRSNNGAVYIASIDFVWNTSSTPSTVATPTFNPANGTEFGDEGLEVTISCETENTTIYYTLDGNTPDNESTEYTGSIALTETTTIKAIAYDMDDNTSSVATAVYTYVDPNAPGTQNNPYTVAEARAAIDANTGLVNVYATGIISQVDSYNSNYNSITYWISDDGTTTSDQLEVYSGKGLNNTNFSSINDVEVGATVVVYGTLKKYNSIYEFDKNNYLVSYEAPIHDVATPTFSPAAGTYAETQTVTIICSTQGADIYYTLDGTEPNDESNPYSSPITVSETTTIKAIAYADDVASTIATATYHINSQANPYTVAQALAFNEYPANSIYVHGIVSTAPTSLSSGTLTYYISDDGGTTDQLEVYKGKDLENAAFTSVDNIQVGDIVTIFGNVQVYNGTIEIGSGNYLVEFERPTIVVPSVTVTPNIINAPAEGAEGNLALAYENITEFYSFDFYFCDAEGEELQEDPDWIYAEINPGADDTYILDYLIDANNGEARTAYMKVYTFDDNEEEVYAIVTVNQAQYVVDYAELPFEYDGNGTGDLPNGFTVSGLGTYSSSPAMKFDGTGDYAILKFNERPGTLTFDIKGNTFSGGTFTVQTSEDGVTYTDLETYTELGDTQHESFANLGENVRYIKWIYTNKRSGNVALGNITLAEYNGSVASITVDPATVNEDAEEHEGTLALTYENLTISDMEDFGIQYYDAEGEETTEPDWIEVLVAEQDPQIGEGYVVSYFMFENEDAARTAYFKVYAMDDETNLVYSNLVTISQATPVAPVTGDKYVKVTSTADLTSGQYLIVYEDGGLAFDGSLETLDATSNTIEVTINDDEIGITNITTASEFTIDVTAGTIMSASGYYIGQTSDANGLASSNTTAYTNTISFDEDGNANIVSGGAYLRYNNASNQNRFRYYKSASYTGQKAIQLYKKVEATETYTLTITGYEEGSKGGYHLIASPVTVDPATVEGMILTGDDAENYDLYRYDDSQELEWINYKGANGGFNLEPGKGYLYAKKNATAETTTTYNFTLTGTPYSGNGVIEVAAGWNLIGNPFNEIVYLEGNPAFYTMNAEGTEIVTATSNSIQAMEGIFVEAESDGTVTFTTTAPTKTNEGIVLNLSHNRGNLVDRAIVRFGEGSQLHKLQIRNNSTKVYIPQNNDEYAVVRGASQGEMPVSFRAAENGNYTFSINAENVELNYLHLIDNMTGANIDLLQNPSYSFDANTTDYESRFRLVYAANNAINEQSVENFAFFSNGNLIVNNEGNATLQVVDITGRLISSNSINGSENINLHNMPAGIYTVRLINGKDVKVQKVAVR